MIQFNVVQSASPVSEKNVFQKKFMMTDQMVKLFTKICWKLIIFGCLKVTFILSDIIWLGNSTSYHIRSYGNILESNITLKLSLLLTVL